MFNMKIFTIIEQFQITVIAYNKKAFTWTAGWHFTYFFIVIKYNFFVWTISRHTIWDLLSIWTSFNNIFIWKVKLQRVTYTEREIERYLSSSKGQWWLGLGQSNTRSQELHLGFPCGCRGWSTWKIFCCLPGA